MTNITFRHQNIIMRAMWESYCYDFAIPKPKKR